MDSVKFEEDTTSIRKWVTHGSVPSVNLAAELLAWYTFVLQGLDPNDQRRVLDKGAALHSTLYDE